MMLALLTVSAAAIEVIGSGWPRTGTDTLKTALDTLGYKTYHMKEIMQNGRTDHMRKWAAQFDVDCKDVDGLRTIFAEYDYTAGVDFPVSACWEQILAAHPNAKVIHIERSSSSWWQSSSSTVWSVARRFPFFIMMKLVPVFRESIPMSYSMFKKVFRDAGVVFTPAEMDEIVAGYPEDHEAKWIAAYEHSNARVRETVRAKQLLIHDHADGWPKLCEFLGKPIPDTPYPHSNKRYEFFVLTRFVMPAIFLGGPLLALATVTLGVRFLIRKARRAKSSEALKKKEG